MNELYEVPIALPEKGEQTRIVELLDSMSADIGANERTARKLQALKTALMQDLLTGRKRVTALLESVAAQERKYAVG